MTSSEIDREIRELSLDEIIALRKENAKANDPSLQDYIADCKGRGGKGRGKLMMKNQHPQEADIYKSLETIIHEREIRHPLAHYPGVNESIKDGVVQGSPAKVTPTKVALRERDPLKYSLDDLIVKEKLGNRSSNQRKEYDDAGLDSSILMNVDLNVKKGEHGQRSRQRFTPYRAVSFLSEKGMIIEMKTGRQEDHSGMNDKSHLWRCEVTCGTIKGECDSSRKAVARELACKDFLTHLKESYPLGKIPNFEVPDELFIDPRVFHMVEKVGVEKAIQVCHELTVKIADERVRRATPLCTYICTYYVGTEECVGESYLVEYAKLKAAKLAYEFLTGSDLYPTKYFLGDECPPDMDYCFNESEVFQVLGMTTEGQNLDFPQDEFSIGSNEGKRALARRNLSENFKRIRKEDQERRRNMPVDVGQMSSRSSTSDMNEATTVIKKEPRTTFQDSKINSEKGSQALGGWTRISKFARFQDKDDNDTDDES